MLYGWLNNQWIHISNSINRAPMAMDTVATLLQTLRKPETPSEKTIDAALETVIAAQELSVVQHVVRALARKLSPAQLIPLLKQAASVCTLPASKSEFLAFELLLQVFLTPEDVATDTQGRNALLEGYTANPGSLEGFSAAIESVSSPFWGAHAICSPTRALGLLEPVFTAVLISNQGETLVFAVGPAVELTDCGALCS